MGSSSSPKPIHFLWWPSTLCAAFRAHPRRPSRACQAMLGPYVGVAGALPARNPRDKNVGDAETKIHSGQSAAGQGQSHPISLCSRNHARLAQPDAEAHQPPHRHAGRGRPRHRLLPPHRQGPPQPPPRLHEVRHQVHRAQRRGWGRHKSNLWSAVLQTYLAQKSVPAELQWCSAQRVARGSRPQLSCPAQVRYPCFALQENVKKI